MFVSPVEEIKGRLDIVNVIGSYVKLQKAGVNYRAPCPFHSEKKPSFFVSPSRQIWHCFGGCGEGGDIFKFVMKIEGVEFGDALRILAQKAGVELKREAPELKTERQRLYEICELTCKFFEKQLEASQMGQEAKKYLLGRGITEESIEKWRIGYAPDVWQGLSDFLNSRGYKQDEIKKAGVGLTSERGSFFDRFRGRIIFPVFDLNSQVVGFGGRVFKDKDKKEIAKYVNTPNTMLYDKSRILYGLDKAKMEVRKKNACILVEGYMDLIMVSQSGVENVAATSGTALTSFQLNILKRYSDNLLTAFDMDVAGDSATKRGIHLAQNQGFNVKVVILPEGLDPADVVSQESSGFEKYIESAKSIYDFYFDTAFLKFDKNTADGKREISKILLPVLKEIPNRIEQVHWIAELAKRLGVRQEDVEMEMKKVNLSHDFLQEEPVQVKQSENQELPLSRQKMLEERLGIMALKYPKVVLSGFSSFCSDDKKIILNQNDFSVSFLNEKGEQAFFMPLIANAEIRDILTIIHNNPETDLKGRMNNSSLLYNALALGADIEEAEEKDAEQEVRVCLKELFCIGIKNQLNQINDDLRKAESDKNSEAAERLMKEFNFCSKSFHNLNQ